MLNRFRSFLNAIVFFILASSFSGPASAQENPLDTSHKTIGPNNCSCHTHKEQNDWWVKDKHYAAVDPFFDEEPKNVQIARLYGIDPSEMTRGNQICMGCHATVISGKETREVLDGVSCERCHGPGGDYKEPHQEGDRALGKNRPGYLKGLQLGMVELKNLQKHAEACAQCHYITNARLISAGHPTGEKFDFVERTKKIKHWPSPLASDAELKAAYDKIIAARGAVPVAAGVSTTEMIVPRDQTAHGSSDKQQAMSLAPQPRMSVKRIELPPFPAINDSTSIEEILLILKNRLELLYRKTGEGK